MLEAAEKYKAKINDSPTLHGTNLLVFFQLRMRLQLLAALPRTAQNLTRTTFVTPSPMLTSPSQKRLSTIPSSGQMPPKKVLKRNTKRNKGIFRPLRGWFPFSQDLNLLLMFFFQPYRAITLAMWRLPGVGSFPGGAPGSFSGPERGLSVEEFDYIYISKLWHLRPHHDLFLFYLQYFVYQRVLKSVIGSGIKQFLN